MPEAAIAVANTPAARAKRPQSRVTGKAARGEATFLSGDKMSVLARRFKDLVGLVTADLGGPSELSENQRQIVRRIASMSVWCESEEAKMADGIEIDIDKFQRTSNSLRRLCETIGLRRVPKDATTLDLRAYLRATESATAGKPNGASPSVQPETPPSRTLGRRDDG